MVRKHHQFYEFTNAVHVYYAEKNTFVQRLSMQSEFIALHEAHCNGTPYVYINVGIYIDTIFCT